MNKEKLKSNTKIWTSHYFVRIRKEKQTNHGKQKRCAQKENRRIQQNRKVINREEKVTESNSSFLHGRKSDFNSCNTQDSKSCWELVKVAGHHLAPWPINRRLDNKADFPFFNF